MITVFDSSNFKSNSKKLSKLCEQMESLFLSIDDKEIVYETCIGMIKSEFQSKDESYFKLRSLMSVNDISSFIDLNYDLLGLCSFIEPNRHSKISMVHYPHNKIVKIANQLEFEILSRIAEQFKTIAEILNEPKYRISQRLELSEIFDDFKKLKQEAI